MEINLNSINTDRILLNWMYKIKFSMFAENPRLVNATANWDAKWFEQNRQLKKYTKA